MCWGQGATQQGKTLLSPCHRLVPLGVESASVCVRVCVRDTVMRAGTQPNGHLTGAVALSWCVAAALAAFQRNSPCWEGFCIRVRWVMWHQMPFHVPKPCVRLERTQAGARRKEAGERREI